MKTLPQTFETLFDVNTPRALFDALTAEADRRDYKAQAVGDHTSALVWRTIRERCDLLRLDLRDLPTPAPETGKESR